MSATMHSSRCFKKHVSCLVQPFIVFSPEIDDTTQGCLEFYDFRGCNTLVPFVRINPQNADEALD